MEKKEVCNCDRDRQERHQRYLSFKKLFPSDLFKITENGKNKYFIAVEKAGLEWLVVELDSANRSKIALGLKPEVSELHIKEMFWLHIVDPQNAVMMSLPDDQASKYLGIETEEGK